MSPVVLKQLTYYNNVNASLIFIPLIILSGEVKTLTEFPLLYSMKFWFPMTVAGAFGFAMGYVVGLQIDVSNHFIFDHLMAPKRILTFFSRHAETLIKKNF